MSTAKYSEVILNVLSSEVTGQSGILYFDDGTNTGGSNNVPRFYDGMRYSSVQKLPEIELLTDQKDLNTNGGSCTASTEVIRTLNTITPNSHSWVSINSTSTFFIDGETYPGNYFIEWGTPSFHADQNTSWLESGGSVLRVGSSEYSLTDAQCYSTGYYYNRITANNGYEIVFKAVGTQATNGIGVTKGTSLQENDLYTTVKITRY